MNRTRHALLACLTAAAAACGGGGGGATGEAPAVTVSEPRKFYDVAAGFRVGISFQASDEDSEAMVSVFADGDGDPATTGDQFLLFGDIPERDGAAEDRTWVTNNVPPGEYHVLVRVDDGRNAPVFGAAPGRVTVRANPPPDTTIDFPPSTGAVEQAVITVRGRATDDHGVDAVTVNGVAAETDDDFATWTATIPLVRGRNLITVAAEDGFGNRAAVAAEATVDYTGPFLESPVAAAFDAAANRAYFVLPRNRVMAVDLATGERFDVGGEHRGEGDLIQDQWLGVAVDASRNRVLVWNGLGGVLAVDLDTGDRTLVFDGSLRGEAGAYDADGQRLFIANGESVSVIDLVAGTLRSYSTAPPAGFQLGMTPGIAWDPTNRLIFIAQWYRKVGDFGVRGSRIAAIDPADGDLTTVPGSGPALPTILSDLRRDATNGRLYVLSDDDDVYTVDPATGDRTLAVDVSAGSGADLDRPERLLVDAARDRVYWIDLRVHPVVAGKLSDGTRAIAVQHDPTGFGEALDGVEDMVLHDDGAVYLAAGNAVLIVDGETGERRVAFASSNPQALAWDATNQRLFVADWTDDAIYETGDGELVSGAGRGAGPEFVHARALLVENGGARLAVLAQDALYHVDTATGNRTLVSSDARGTGPEFGSAERILADPRGGGYLVAHRRGVYAVDPVTGDRTDVTSSDRGSGALRPAALLSLDALSANTLLGIDPFWEYFIEIDIATGDRTEILGEFAPLLSFGHAGNFAARYDAERRVVHLIQARDLFGPQAYHVIDLATGMVARRAD